MEKPQYTFGSAAGEVLKKELNERELHLFARHFVKYCSLMNAIEEIKGPYWKKTLWMMGRDRIRNYLDEAIAKGLFPIKMKTFALNSIAYIHKKHVRGKNFKKIV